VSRVRQERGRLAHKVKKETKSAIRELKQDNAFLARTQQKHEMQLYVTITLILRYKQLYDGLFTTKL